MPIIYLIFGTNANASELIAVDLGARALREIRNTDERCLNVTPLAIPRV
jgi:hypothetical protein